MNGKWFSLAALIAAATFLLSLSSCGFNQHLLSISIVPSGFTYGSAAAPGSTQTPIPLTAYGTYNHPPETKNITDQVIWASDVTPVALVDSTGNLTAGTSCGGANISASVYTDGGNKNGNVVVGFMFVTVDGPASLGCTPAGTPPTLTVNFNGTGSGTVISSPSGVDCSAPSSCSAQFQAGTSVTLTGSPTAPSTSVTWNNGCNTAMGTTCTVILENSVTVTATFQ
jgi:hypothetical protein